MGKKRKVIGKALAKPDSRYTDPANAKLRINTFEDVADSEDEFHINRDKILLEDGPAQKRQRRAEEEDALLGFSDEEVLADASDRDEEYDTSEEESTPRNPTDKTVTDAIIPRNSSEASEERENEEGWGASKRDYYNADVIETEANALEEEEEAIRLQKKRLQSMNEADFGFDEAELLETKEADVDGEVNGHDGVIREVLPQIVITDAMTPIQRTNILRARYPEFEPLAKEFLRLQLVHENSMKHDKFILLDAASEAPMVLVKQNALSTYLAVLSMYFALLTSGDDSDGVPVGKDPSELRDHPIMESLIQCRNLWERVKDYESPEAEGMDMTSTFNGRHQESNPNRVIEPQDLTGDPNKYQGESSKQRKSRKSKARRAAEAALLEADACRAERLQKTEQDLAKLSELTFPIKKIPKSTASAKDNQLALRDDDSDFGEETSLTTYEADEKAKRKRTLRFYTSQIAQKANKRDIAGRDAGGDADLPYRERFRDKQARLNQGAEAKGSKGHNKARDALGGESDEEDREAVRAMKNNADDDDYYDLVAARSQKKKSGKAALAAAQRQAAEEGGLVRIVEEIQADGKRGITYAIEKNKGLAPKRKKDVRNPRVKKRKKFEEKKKKLASVRPVYKGGEGKGGYGGELTGIKKGLVRSVKL